VSSVLWSSRNPFSFGVVLCRTSVRSASFLSCLAPRQAVEKLDERLRRIAGLCHGIQGDLVCLVLMWFLLASGLFEQFGVTGCVVEESVELFENVFPIADRRQAKNLLE
jgi:hypothetical protein